MADKGCSKKRLKIVFTAIFLLLTFAAILFVVIYFAIGSNNDDEVHKGSDNGNDPVKPEEPEPVYRLPFSLKPQHYDLELRPDIYTKSTADFRLYGAVTIRVLCKEVTSSVILHAIGLNISRDSMTVTAVGATGQGGLDVKSWATNKARETLEMELSGPLVKGVYYDLHVTFTAPLTETFVAVYYSAYKENGVTEYLAASIFVPTYARRAFPCYDEPALKANFTLTILRKTDYIALANMPVINTSSRTIDGEQWVVDVFQESPPMSTYLLAFTVCRFKSIEANTTRGYKFIAWSRPQSVNQTHFALDVGTRVMPYFDDYFGIPFALPEQEMIAMPDFQYGGMEHWGLVAYKERAMLYSDALPSVQDKQTIALVVSHELAHMWFGDLLTMVWWDDTWLNEGFATFMEHEGMDSAFPLWRVHDQFVVDALRFALSIDAFENSRPLFKEVLYPDDILAAYDRIIYYKGASIVRMVKFFLGNETFVKGIQKYINDFAYATATHVDLWNSLSVEAERQGLMVNVTDVMRGWTVQNNFPVVTVTRNKRGQIVVSQSRYLLKQSESNGEYMWDIPFTFATTTTHIADVDPVPDDVIWLSRDRKEVVIIEKSIPGPGDTDGWVLANIGCYGYYRVNYDVGNWMALVRQLHMDHTKIHTSNRAQIIMDSWNLARAGLLNYTIALDTLGYQQNETSYLPWKAALTEVKELQNLFSIEDEIHAYFSTFMRRQTEGVFNRFEPNAGIVEDLDQRTPILVASQACAYGVKSCLTMARTQFDAWKNNPSDNSIIQVDLRQTVYCTAISNGTQDVWDFVFTQYTQATTASESARLRLALACSRDSDILEMLMERTLNATYIPQQDAIETIVAVSSNPYGTALAWDFVKKKFPTLKVKFGNTAFTMKELISGVTASFHTQSRLQELESLAQQNPDVASQMTDAMEKTRANVEWVDTNLGVVRNWLRQQNSAYI